MPYRGLCACHEYCPVRDCSAPVVPRQEEFSGAATAWGWGCIAKKRAHNFHVDKTVKIYKFTTRY